MRILWHSVAPWAPTGYGTQTGLFTPRIRDLGHDIALSVYYGHQGSEMMWNGIKVYPSYSAAYGSDVIVPNALHHFDAHSSRSLHEASCRGIIITLGDVWTFESPLLDQLAVGSWVPIDHLQVPDVTRNWLKTMGAVPIAMSRFGEQALQDAGFNPMYVPHGVDLNVFRPGDQTAARKSVGLPEDAFVVGIVANNIGRDGNRKAFSEQITAFAQLRRKHSDAMLVIHCDVDQPAGMRLRPFLERSLPKGSYTYTDIYAYRKGLNPAAVAEVYRAADVLSNCSYGEGFGIPIMEAQACGIPVIVTDATAMPELVGAGWKVGYEPLWHDSQGAWAAKPRIGEIVQAYEEAYDHARDEDMRALAWGKAQDYDADAITERYWNPALDRFADALERRREDFTRPPDPARLPVQIRSADGLLWVDRGGRSGDQLGPDAHEQDLWPILEGLLPEGGVLLDVGAHVGHWSLRLAAKASRVIAVEANPVTASTLRRNVALNDLGDKVTVVELAAWDETASLRLFDPYNQVAGGSTRVMPTDNGDGTVQADRLDNALYYAPIIERPKRIDLVKLDVEGADIHAIDGMADLLANYHPALFIELHDIYGYYTRADLEAALERVGYVWEVAHTIPTTWMPDGESDVVQQADYLLATPARVGARGGLPE
jgi:FkbM family methyltransferase